MRYFLYARKSTEDKARQIQSIPDQLRILNELAAQRGLQIVDTITDEKSAKAPGRPGFTSMIQRIQAGEADGILCWKVDRLSRNSVDGGTLMWMLQNCAIREILTSDRTYYPNDNTLLLSVEFGLATQVIRELSTNVKRGMGSKIEKGWMPTRAPLGYLNEKGANKGAKRILPHPELFPVVQGLWKHLLNEQCSLMELFEHMQRHAPLYRSGKIIGFSTFHRMFQNKFYCGLFLWAKEWKLGAHKPMITQREFEAAQSYLFQKKSVRNGKLEFDLKGEFRCGTCDAMLTAEEHRKMVKRQGIEKAYRFYRCGHRKRGIVCREKPLSEAKIEAQILRKIEDIALPEEIITFGMRTLEAMEANSQESLAEKQGKRALSEIRQRIHIVESNLAEESDADTRMVMKRKLNELRIQKTSLEQDIAQAETERKTKHVTIRNSLELVHSAKHTFTHGTKDQRRAIIRGLGSNWVLMQKELICKPSFIASALTKTKQTHLADIRRLELAKSQSGTGGTVCQKVVANVWSG